MKPTPQQEKLLIGTLRRKHGSRFQDLQTKAKEFADGLNGLRRFKLIEASEPSKHVGRVIVDGVLQVGKGYENQVRKAVTSIKQYNQAATVTGFIELLNSRPLKELLTNFKTKTTQKDLLNVAAFFQQQGIDTFNQLYDWLESENNRDKLLTKNSKLAGPVFRIADGTADYFRKLVGHWDAVNVNKGIKNLLAETGVMPRYSTKWSYKEKWAIVQLAALNLGCTPRDLDTSIYRYYDSTKS